MLGAGYTGTRGLSLDMVRAPNRGPTGLRIPDVQPFTWQSSEASSQLHAGTFRFSRRPVAGIGAGVSYTLAKSRDNASTLGGGRTSVAQDDQNLDAEWALSSLRPAAPGLGEREHRAAVRREPAVPQRRRHLGRAARELARQHDVHVAVGRAVHADGLRRRRRRRPRHERHAARQLHRRADPAREPDDRSLLQHRRVHDSRFRTPTAMPRAT